MYTDDAQADRDGQTRTYVYISALVCMHPCAYKKRSATAIHIHMYVCTSHIFAHFVGHKNLHSLAVKSAYYVNAAMCVYMCMCVCV